MFILSLGRIRVLQPLRHRSEEEWGIASDHRSASIELHYQTILVQDAHYQTDRVSDQVRGPVCHDRSQGRILPCIHPSSTQEVSEVCFRGTKHTNIGFFVWPITLTPHFHEAWGCCLGSVVTPGHLHTKLHRQLVDFSSVRADGGSASRCRPHPYERAGVTVKRTEECTFSTTENLLSRRDMGFDNDAGTVVSCSYRSDSRSRERSEGRPVTKVPSWDLAVVLEALFKAPFKPIEDVSDMLVTLKTIFLLAISSLKRIRDLQALAVAGLEFAPGMARAFFFTRDPGMSLKFPPPRQVLSYCRSFALLPSRKQARKGSICCVQTLTFTELPSGVKQISCLFALVRLGKGFQRPSRP